jgi:iron(III) transport system substrate-binding protein
MRIILNNLPARAYRKGSFVKTLIKTISPAAIWIGLTFPILAMADIGVYSAREEALIKPLLDRFTQQTGIKVKLLTADADALLKRIEREGEQTPADVYLTVDVTRLIRAQTGGVLQAVKSPVLEQAIPAAYRDPQGYWFGLSLRARVIAYAKDRVKPQDLSGYQDLADPKWRGKICVRSSNSPYNQSLVAAMIARDGAEKTETWARGLVANFARAPKGGDRAQVEAVAAGQCDLALINSYYLAEMLMSKDANEKAAAEKAGLLWPDQAGHGAHMNVSGAGITKSAQHRDEALRLLEFLVSDDAQRWYSASNFEFPVKPGIETSEVLKKFGNFKADTMVLAELGKYQTIAVKLMDRAGWR